MRPKPIEPKPGQESVWAYPRPPRLETCQRRLQVFFNGVCLADTRRGFRVLETSHPPNYYFPPSDVRTDLLASGGRGSLCEWKGRAGYYSVEVGGRRAESAAWYYTDPSPVFADLAGCIAFYAALMDTCLVDCESVTPQEGGFYGGWITSDIVGPFKGGPGSRFW